MATTCPARTPSSSFRTNRSVLPAIKSRSHAIRSRVVRVSALQNPFEKIFNQKRAGKKATKKAEKAVPQEEPTPEKSTDESLISQPGDVVTVAWECALAATGEVVDSSSRGPMTRHVQFQMGTDAGFEPKRGLKLAYSLVTEGLAVGEMARVVSRPSGSGMFKAYEVVSMDGQLLAQLQPDEKQSPWAEDETVFTLEVLEITPPRGRATGKRRRAASYSRGNED